MQSLYNAIYESLNSEGKLPKDFILPSEETSPNQPNIMPGANEGICIFHFDIKCPEEAPKKSSK